MSPAHNGQSNDDKDDTDDNVTASMTLPPSARKILKQRKKKQASIMPGNLYFIQYHFQFLDLYK